jgi:hypothetical protein
MIKFGDGSPICAIIKRDRLFSIEDNLLRTPRSSLLARVMRCRVVVGFFCSHDDEIQAQGARSAHLRHVVPIKYRENASIKSSDRSHPINVVILRLR